jgi:hypothetical protein
MSNDEVAVKAREVEKMIVAARADAPSSALWRQLLSVCGQTEDSVLLAMDFEHYSRLTRNGVEEIVAAHPMPDHLAFVYFGLYDLLASEASAEASRVGFYFAGGVDHNCAFAIENGDLSYFPAKRRIHLDLFDLIREAGRKTPERREVFEWLLLLAAAGVLAKGAVSRLKVQVPTFVGFDSGDYLQVRE